ncbi:MAG: arsenate reductase ArsC, partial [Actinobacteria bacterium]|nr:arsenate reductase ArsC [Actinomycetota bacterium]
EVSERLHIIFKKQFSLETIEKYVFESYSLLDAKSEVKLYLMAMAERFARDRLYALLKSEKLVESEKLDILYVCVHNSGRSQMAAGFTAKIGGDRVTVRSAGSAPKESISKVVLEAMAELGIDITQEFPKPLTDEVVRASDAVITMGCGDACPIYPGKRYEDWVLDDPAGQDLQAVRVIRDQIKLKVETLLSELLAKA